MSRSNAEKVVRYGFVGSLYGVTLLCASFLAIGMGRGTEIIGRAAAAPFGLLDDFGAALLTIPFVWCVIGVAIGMARQYRRPWPFVMLIALHYLGVAILIWPRSRPADWSYVPRSAVPFAIGAAAYLAGQATIWFVFFGHTRGIRQSAVGASRRLDRRQA